MAYVIADPCIATCDTACVDACPVDCIHAPLPTEEIRASSREALAARSPRLQMFIDPEACICCAACVPECPVSAIFDEDDVPAEWADAPARNRAHFARGAGAPAGVTTP